MTSEIINLAYKIYLKDFNKLGKDEHELIFIPFRIINDIPLSILELTLIEFGQNIKGIELKDITTYRHSEKYYKKILSSVKNKLLKQKINIILK